MPLPLVSTSSPTGLPLSTKDFLATDPVKVLRITKCMLLKVSPSLLALTGEQRVQLTQSRIRVNVVLAGLSLPWEAWNPASKSAAETFCSSLSSNLSTAAITMEVKVATVVMRILLSIMPEIWV